MTSTWCFWECAQRTSLTFCVGLTLYYCCCSCWSLAMLYLYWWLPIHGWFSSIVCMFHVILCCKTNCPLGQIKLKLKHTHTFSLPLVYGRLQYWVVTQIQVFAEREREYQVVFELCLCSSVEKYQWLTTQYHRMLYCMFWPERHLHLIMLRSKRLAPSLVWTYSSK